MNNQSINLIYNNIECILPAFPLTYSQLKKEAKKIFCMPESYLFLLSNVSGSKTPITTSKAYARAISFAQVKTIELISADSSSQELSNEIDFEFSGNKNRAILSKRKIIKKNYEAASEEELCVICYDRMKIPMAAKCGHICCKSCWEKALKNFLECPMCKARVRISQLKKI